MRHRARYLKSADICAATGLSRSQIAREGGAGEIPGAVRRDGVHFAFQDTPELRAWCKWRAGVSGRKPRKNTPTRPAPNPPIDRGPKGVKSQRRNPTPEEWQAFAQLCAYSKRDDARQRLAEGKAGLPIHVKRIRAALKCREVAGWFATATANDIDALIAELSPVVEAVGVLERLKRDYLPGRK